MIVARSWPKNIIGMNNKLPWRLPSDLRRFRQITSHHSIVMGRRTFESIGRPLPNRTNVVLSRSSNHDGMNTFWNNGHDGLFWTNDFSTALFVADMTTIARGKRELFIIGGSEMYNIFSSFINKIYLTEVFTLDREEIDIQGDAFFDMKIDRRKWKMKIEEECFSPGEDEYKYRYSVFERRIKYVRQIDHKSFFTAYDDKKDWIESQLKMKANELIKKKITSRDQLELMFDTTIEL
jgi:dihydrofolate reductase